MTVHLGALNGVPSPAAERELRRHAQLRFGAPSEIPVLGGRLPRLPVWRRIVAALARWLDCPTVL